ncbi:hypothetical protein NQZ79_g2846 [Umbelopsis isabellina]|nr:hypothetical protein NQZ79_g2846 [Umbelopsis isabellina]
MNTSSSNHVTHSTLLSQPYTPMTRSSYSNQQSLHFHSAAANGASRMDLALGPSSAPSQPPNAIFPPFEHSLKSVNIGSWVARKKPLDPKPVVSEDNDSSWRDVYRNIKCMDQLYDATFYSWLKSEDNVLVTAVYLHRIANEYPLVRIINALKWLISDWRLESISILVRHVTVDCWATQYTATLITTILATPPYQTSTNQQRERFLRAFAQDWDFSKLSEFFMYLQSRANVDYKVKCVMLQEAARKERETLGAKLSKKRGATSAHIPDYRKSDISLHHEVEVPPSSANGEEVISVISAEKMRSLDTSETTNNTSKVSGLDSVQAATPAATDETTQTRRHHRRTSSNDVTDIKRLRLSTPNFDNANEESSNANGLSSSTSSLVRLGNNATAASAQSSTTVNNTRRAATPDHRSSSSSFNCELPSSSQSSRPVRHGIPNDMNSTPSTPSQRSPTSSAVTPSTAFSRHHHHYHPYASATHPTTTSTSRRRSSSGASTSSSNNVAPSEVITSKVDEECEMEDVATSKRRALI